ncbi:MAG TPA: hypothetical protein VFR47_14695 [Anaerolineales bacterium]|nr:hypothetical protein [Anaerolineales bacterium]
MHTKKTRLSCPPVGGNYTTMVQDIVHDVIVWKTIMIVKQGDIHEQ